MINAPKSFAVAIYLTFDTFVVVLDTTSSWANKPILHFAFVSKDLLASLLGDLKPQFFKLFPEPFVIFSMEVILSAASNQVAGQLVGDEHLDKDVLEDTLGRYQDRRDAFHQGVLHLHCLIYYIGSIIWKFRI